MEARAKRGIVPDYGVVMRLVDSRTPNPACGRKSVTRLHGRLRLFSITEDISPGVCVAKVSGTKEAIGPVPDKNDDRRLLSWER